MSGIHDGDFDRVTIVQDLGVGQDREFGTNGQVLTSGGEGEPLFWGTNSATLPQGLVAGTNITFSPSGTYNGSVETTISATDTNTEYTAGNGIQISGSNVIQTKTDNQTIKDSGGGSGNNLEVIKVPNTLTITDSAGTSVVYDGETAKSITINDSDTTYQADLGVEIDITTDPHTIKAKVDSDAQPTLRNDYNSNELQVLRVPNNLTVNLGLEYQTGTSYDGSALRTLVTKVDDTTPSTQTISNTSGTGFDELKVLRVPNALTITKTDGTDVVFDGASAESITLTTDTGITTLNEGDGINITDVSATEKTISANIDTNTLEFKTDTLGAPEPKEIAVKKLPHTLTITDSAGTSVVFDGDVDKSITINDNNTEYTATQPIRISASDVISIGLDDYPDGTETLKVNTSNEVEVVRVPNTLTVTQGAVSTIFDGSSSKTISIASGSADHSVVSRIGHSATISTFTSPHTSVNPTLTTGMVGIAGWGIEGMTAVSTDYEISVDFLMTQEARSGVQTSSSYIRLDSVANNTIVGWGSANGVYAPIEIQSGNQGSNTLSNRAFYGRLSYKWIISNLTVGSSYNFIPRFTTYAPSSSSLVRMAIQYGGKQGFATVTATPISVNTPTGMSEQQSGDDY